MKKSLILFSFLALTTYQVNAQNSENYKMSQLMAAGGHNFQITGDGSDAFADSLFTHLPETKRKGYVWKFKNVLVSGIDEPVTFQVHQGLAGQNENKTGYFNTFTSEKYKQLRLSQNIPSEEHGIIIYVRRGKNRNSAIKTVEEAALVRAYLETMI